MSGGPVLNEAGGVVGVSEATAGNQISFLVPAAFVKKLMSAAPPAPDGLLDLAKKQVLDHQNAVIDALVQRPFETVALGPFRLPDRPSAAFKCWAKPEAKADDPFHATHAQCSTEDPLFINESLTTGVISFVHHGIDNGKLNAFQKTALQQSYVGREENRLAEAVSDLQTDMKEELTAYSCGSSFVKAGEADLKAILCLRAYKKIPGLYDVEWRAASVMEEPRWTVTSVVTMEGVSVSSAEKFLKSFMGSYSWKAQ
jgi:serine protease Do